MSRRWIPWHLFCLTVVILLFGLGVWQWRVATGSAYADGPAKLELRNLVYALQWWVFGCFGVWFWFRFIRDERDKEDLASQPGATARAVGEPAEAVAANEAEPVEDDVQISLDAPAAVRLRSLQANLPDGPASTGR